MEEEELKERSSLITSIASDKDVNHQLILVNDMKEMGIAYRNRTS